MTTTEATLGVGLTVLEEVTAIALSTSYVYMIIEMVYKSGYMVYGIWLQLSMSFDVVSSHPIPSTCIALTTDHLCGCVIAPTTTLLPLLTICIFFLCKPIY